MYKPVLLVFGNCQAGAVADSIRYFPGIAGVFEMLYIPSFNFSEAEERAALGPDVRKRVTLLFEQVTPFVNLRNRYDFPAARVVTFPSLDFNVIWPQRAEEPRMRPELPGFPFGRFTYGDKFINQVVAAGLCEEEAWQVFASASAAAMPDLVRFAQVEARRWQAAEKLVDVKMSDVIFPSFRKKRLFWTYNHPHRDLLCELGGRLVAAAGLMQTRQKAVEVYSQVLTWPFGEDYHAPIHPLVAQGLGLEWWHEDMCYRRYDDEFGYEEFIRAQIAWR